MEYPDMSESALPPQDYVRHMHRLAAEIFARHGITEEEMDILWNYYAAIAFESIWHQEGVFYEKVKKLFEPRSG